MNSKVGRNDPCPCGSGKKYKNCCFGKEEKKTYTPAGKRKFKAKVISLSSEEKQLFKSATTPATEAATASLDSLRFRITNNDYRTKEDEIKDLKFATSEDEPTTVKQEKALFPLQEEFKMTEEDFRKKNDE